MKLAKKREERTFLKTTLVLAVKMVSVPCIHIQSIPYHVALSYLNTFFNSAFLAFILYLTRAFSLNSSLF